MTLEAIFLFIFALLWGSFLNMLAYRLVHRTPLFETRSRCDSCLEKIAWYDLIPVISWIFLSGKCRKCCNPISYLYPLIEIISGVSFLALYTFVDSAYFFGYFILFSCLIITIRTDLETMQILRLTTIGIIPIGLLLSIFRIIPISTLESFTGAILGYSVLWFANFLSRKISKKDGFGQGDLELLAAIGSFVGPKGSWFSLLIGAFLGSTFGITKLATGTMKISEKMPFGHFLSIGTMILIVFGKIFLLL